MTDLNIELSFNDDLDNDTNLTEMQLIINTALVQASSPIEKLSIHFQFQFQSEVGDEDIHDLIESHQGFDFAHLLNPILGTHGPSITELELQFSYTGFAEHLCIERNLSILELQHLNELSAFNIVFNCESHELHDNFEHPEVFSALLRCLNTLPNREQLKSLSLSVENLVLDGSEADIAEFRNFFDNASQLETFGLDGLNYQNAGDMEMIEIIAEHPHLRDVTIHAHGSLFDLRHLSELLKSTSIQSIDWISFDLIEDYNPEQFLQVWQQFGESLSVNSALREIQTHLYTYNDSVGPYCYNHIVDRHFFDDFYRHLSSGIAGPLNLSTFVLDYQMIFKYPEILRPYLLDIGQNLSLTHLAFPQAQIPEIIDGLDTSIEGLQAVGRVTKDIHRMVYRLIFNEHAVDDAVIAYFAARERTM